MKTTVTRSVAALVALALCGCASGCFGSGYKGRLQNVYIHFGIEIPRSFDVLYSDSSFYCYVVYSTANGDEKGFIESNGLSSGKNERMENLFENALIVNDSHREEREKKAIPDEYKPDFEDDYCWRFISSKRYHIITESGNTEEYFIYEEDFDEAFTNRVFIISDTDKQRLYVCYWLT